MSAVTMTSMARTAQATARLCDQSEAAPTLAREVPAQTLVVHSSAGQNGRTRLASRSSHQTVSTATSVAMARCSRTSVP